MTVHPDVSAAVTDLACPNCRGMVLVMAMEDVATVYGPQSYGTLRCSTCGLQITHPYPWQLREIWTRLQRIWPEATTEEIRASMQRQLGSLIAAYGFRNVVTTLQDLCETFLAEAAAKQQVGVALIWTGRAAGLAQTAQVGEPAREERCL